MYVYIICIFGPELCRFNEMAQKGRRVTLMRNEVTHDFSSFWSYNLSLITLPLYPTSQAHQGIFMTTTELWGTGPLVT